MFPSPRLRTLVVRGVEEALKGASAD